MTKWFIEAPNSILDTEKAFLEIKDLAVAVRFHCLETNRDTPSFVVEFISVLVFNISYQVLTRSKIQDFMVYETAQVYIGWSGRNFYMVINFVLIALFSTWLWKH